MVFIGLISYPLYLWHWPLLSFARLTSFDDPPRWEREVLVYSGLVATSFFLAWLTYILLERPIRSSRRTAWPAVALVAVALVIGGVGLSIDRVGGLPSRAADATGVFQSDSDPNFWNAFYDHAVSCGAVNGNSAISYLCQSAPAAEPKIAVIGDSHARALYPGLVQALPGENVIFLRSCAFPLVGLIEANRPFNGYCPASTSDQQVAYLAGINSLETVILSFRGPLYLLGKGFGSAPAEREHDVVLEAADTGQRGLTQAQLFSFGLSGAIDGFERANKRVVVVLDVPELGFDITDCIFDKPFHPRLTDCRVPRSAVEARQQEYRAVIDELHSRHRNLMVFDTLPLLCDEQFCYGIKDHHVIYQDNNHIGEYGSKLIGANIAEFLLNK
jgi:hypothetical protein